MNYTDKGLLILGAGVMQGPAIRIAREMGLKTIVADGDPNAPCAGLADRFEHIDLKDTAGIEALGRRLQGEGSLDGVMTAGTDFSATVAWVAERLGLPGIPYEAALNASDKARMRKRFQNAGLPSPRFVILDRVPDEDALPFAYPVVVKPVDNMGARGCRRADRFEDLQAAAADALGFSRSSRAIVEEYMEGPEFSVDALVYNGEMTVCGVADRHIFFPPYFIEMGHTMPTAITRSKEKALLETFAAGAKALGITNGAAKGDIKLTPKGPMIGEIAARLSGGYMSGWTYPYASGVLVTRGAIQIALGLPPDGLASNRRWTSAERAFISIPGRVRTILGAEAAGAGEYVKNVFLRIAPGSRVSFPENNVTKCGNIITAAPQWKTAVDAADQAARSILIRLEAPNDETSRFLSADGKFPPDAFTLPADVRVRLEQLPGSSLEQTPPPPAPADGPTETPAEIRVLPFPELLASGLTDYAGRTIAESLDAVRVLTGRPLRFTDQPPGLGREFWAALVRGGYQGAAYAVDTIR